MRFLPLLLANLGRKKLRTVLTIGSFMVALFLFGLLAAVRSGFRQGVDIAGADRLVVIGRTGVIQLLPQPYQDRIRRLPGVADVTHSTWFGGIYQDPKNFFPQFVIVPDQWRRMYPEYVVPPDEWRRTLDVNVTGQFLCARRAVPLLRAAGGGAIINLSSAAGRLGFPRRTPYAASKWAVVGFTKSLAMEFGPDNIRVNAILPGAAMRRVVAPRNPASE